MSSCQCIKHLYNKYFKTIHVLMVVIFFSSFLFFLIFNLICPIVKTDSSSIIIGLLGLIGSIYTISSYYSGRELSEISRHTRGQVEKLSELSCKINKQVELLEGKVFGSLYDINLTVKSMLDRIDTAKPKAKERQKNRDDFYIMAYWLWFGVDEGWKKVEDLQKRDCRFYNRIISRILCDTEYRNTDSKTTLVTFDPVKQKSFLQDLIKYLIKYKFPNIEEAVLIEYIEKQYNYYLSDIKTLKEEIKKHNFNDVLYYAESIPVINFVYDLEIEKYGVSFLGEFDFFKIGKEELEKIRISNSLNNVSLFFGYQTNDPNLANSLILQILAIAAEDTSEKVAEGSKKNN